MNLRNDYSTSGKKMFKRKANYSKLSFKKGIKVIDDDPAFHLNRTLKQYINNKLSKNISGENNNTNIDSKIINNLSSFVPKVKDNDNCLSRSNTVADIIKKRKLFSIKKNSKFKKINYSSKSKSSSGKKMIKSLSSNKYNLNLSNYKVIINKKNINLNINKINKNQILKKNSNNSTQKYIRYSGSTALSINDNNQLLEKNSAIFPYNNYNNNYNNNILLSNNSTLEINNLKTPMRKTTDKKNKYTMQYYTQNNYYNYTNIKNKEKKYNNNICLVKNNKNVNNKNYQNNMTLDGNVNLKSISSYNQPINNSSIKNGSNILYNPSDMYKDDNTNNTNNNNVYCYTVSNMNNTPQKCNNNIFDMNLTNNMNKSINICSTNKIEDKVNKEYLRTDNSFEYIKRIEFLENENKFLKGEINESKNKLLLLENKINKLLVEKNSIEKEECPRPTPYVKKYSMETLQNFQPSPSIDININNSEIQKKEKERKINNNLNEKIINENSDKTMVNKSLVNKVQKYIYQPTNIIKEKQKMNDLRKNKSSHYIKSNINTKNKINVNKNYKKISNNINDKKKMWKKVNNMKQLVDKYRFTHLNFYTEGNINNI